MAEIQVTLTEDEMQYVVRVLEGALGDTRVEMRHTRTTEYRAKVRREEDLIRDLLDKLRPLAQATE